MAKKLTASIGADGDPVRARVQVRHDFTAEELREIGSEAARAYQVIHEKEDAIKAASAVAKSAIKELEARLGELMNKQTNGYEMRDTDALVEFRKKQGKKRLLWNAPGDPKHRTLIREEAMTETDYESLPMDIELLEVERPAVEARDPESGEPQTC